MQRRLFPVQIILNNCLNKVKTVFPSHLCHWWTPLRWWEPPGWNWTKVNMRAEDVWATSACFIPPGVLFNSCLPTSGAMSQICQLAQHWREKLLHSLEQRLLQVSYSCYSSLDTTSIHLIPAVMKLGNFCHSQGDKVRYLEGCSVKSPVAW